MKRELAPAKMGRPRAFDADAALDRAMRVFWKKGYEGASLSELTKAMRINRPSLYAAFGNKEELFRKALDRYAEGPAAYVRQALQATTARAAVEQLLDHMIKRSTDAKNPAGCLMVQGALACSDAANSIREELSTRRAATETALRHRFQLAKREGEFSLDVDPADLARYFATIIQGLAVQHAGGAGHAELRRVVKMALRSWPTSKRKGTLRHARK